MNLEDLLSQLHTQVTQEIINRIEEGTATSGDIANAIKLLKDNNIVISKHVEEETNPLDKLMDLLPDEDPNAYVNRQTFNAKNS